MPETDRKTDRHAGRQASQKQYTPSTFSKLKILVSFLNLPNYQISYGSSPWRVIHVIYLVDRYGLTLILDKWRLDIENITCVAAN